MTTLALIAVRLAEEVLAASARERWHGVSNLPSSGNDFMSSVWFKIGALVLFLGTIIALAAVSLYNRFGQRKMAERAFAHGVSRKQLTEQETSTLIAIVNRVGLERMADIFLMGDVFDRGAGILVKESFADGNPTNETVHLEKQLTTLKAKMNFRKVAAGAYNSKNLGGKSAEIKPAGPVAGKWIFVALFPFRKTDLINSGSKENAERGHSPPQWREQLPKFVPAAITGLVGRVLFIETWLPANVGDRVLITVGSYNINGDYCNLELIEDIGTVDRSVYLSESAKAGEHRRLDINLAGLSESQAAQLAEVIKLAKDPQTKKQNVEDSKEAAGASGPIGDSGESEMAK